MPPLLGLVLLGAGVVVGYRVLQMAAEHLRAGSSRGPEETGPAADSGKTSPPIKDLGALELDPTSGVYKPKSE